MRSPPPRDAGGNIIPHDHKEILDSYHVIRHITPHDLHHETSSGVVRVASGAYSESSDGGMSVDIEEWMAADGLLPTHFISDPNHGAVRLRVGDLRQEGLKVGWDPDNGHAYHDAVWGVGKGSSRRRRIAKLAVTVRKADGET